MPEAWVKTKKLLPIVQKVIVKGFLHCTININSSLSIQIRTYRSRTVIEFIQEYESKNAAEIVTLDDKQLKQLVDLSVHF